MYTFWKRTSAPPTMTMLDAPSRESCTARRERTNTPLQALMLLNEVQFVECARNLAQRALLLEEASASGDQSFTDDQSRLAWIFESLTSRPPSESEISELTGLLADARSTFANQAKNASLLLKVGDSPVNSSVATEELAAWTVVASTLLNLDQVVTK
ncbi:MAG: DUF1553 domain-containing protein [Pirellulaceae bacterium]